MTSSTLGVNSECLPFMRRSAVDGSCTAALSPAGTLFLGLVPGRVSPSLVPGRVSVSWRILLSGISSPRKGERPAPWLDCDAAGAAPRLDCDAAGAVAGLAREATVPGCVEGRGDGGFAMYSATGRDVGCSRDGALSRLLRKGRAVLDARGERGVGDCVKHS